MSDITLICYLTERLCLSCKPLSYAEISGLIDLTFTFTLRSKFKTPHFSHKATIAAHPSTAFVPELSPLASMVLDSSDIAYKCEKSRAIPSATPLLTLIQIRHPEPLVLRYHNHHLYQLQRCQPHQSMRSLSKGPTPTSKARRNQASHPLLRAGRLHLSRFRRYRPLPHAKITRQFLTRRRGASSVTIIKVYGLPFTFGPRKRRQMLNWRNSKTFYLRFSKHRIRWGQILPPTRILKRTNFLSIWKVRKTRV